jgi:tetratricopeptide (TPR) repeat protein
MMTVACNDRDRIFEDGTAAEWLALEAHAADCQACSEELRAWKSLSVAAQEMRDYSESPAFWTRIERALAEEDVRRTRRWRRKGWFSFLQNIPVGWQTAVAGAFVLALTVSAGWIYIHRPTGTPVSDQSLLKSAALKNVENAEAAYVQAIDKLAAEARPQLDTPATPLLANYHEKLVLLDSAIADLRAQAGMNPSNAQLRHQLLAMYQEKQHTLEEVLEVRQQ